MPLFKCECCGCIENTALGHYWSRFVTKFKDSTMNEKALCSECMPDEFIDGTKTKGGKWHGKFPKKQAKEEHKGTLDNY